MGEPVPDRVAQTFLKYFLEAFSRGESLYLSVREARERLQGLESQFPCASWLPVIFQNPAATPPSWNTFLQRGDLLPVIPEKAVNPETSKLQLQLNLHRITLVLPLLSLCISALVIGTRHLGFLQSWELQAFDHLRR